ncbi:hypothetical protein WJX82_010798 [Trebouxia sp. C0006]
MWMSTFEQMNRGLALLLHLLDAPEGTPAFTIWSWVFECLLCHDAACDTSAHLARLLSDARRISNAREQPWASSMLALLTSGQLQMQFARRMLAWLEKVSVQLFLKARLVLQSRVLGAANLAMS